MSVAANGMAGLLRTAQECYERLFGNASGGDAIFPASDLDAIERADGEAFFAAMLQTALQIVDLDTAEPTIMLPFQSDVTRHLDNGSGSVYGMALIDEQHRYRVRGHRAEECYLALTMYAADSGGPDRTVWAANHLQLPVGPNEWFDVELTPTDGAVWLNIRQYFRDPARDAHGKFSIEMIDGPPSERGSPASIAEGWERAARYLESVTGPGAAWSMPAPLGSPVPNTLGDPSKLTEAMRITKDQFFATGNFDLGDDEMLVMQTRWPTASYASATVWNHFSQSVDRRLHRSTINDRESTADADGSVRLVVAPRDPGVPNWLDTGGRRRGSLFWRFILPEGPLYPIECHVARIGDR